MPDSANPQYSDPGPLFGGQADYASTGAPGSMGAQASDAMPDSAFHPQVTMPYQSVQNEPVPTVGVGYDDANLPAQTDIYAGRGADPVAGSHAGFGSTGAGQGSTMARHPNAGR